MISRLLAFTLTIALLTTTATVHAQETPPASDTTLPLEISADQGLEWDRVAHTYVAKGRAEARQGEMRVTSDTLSARYDPDSGGSDIREVSAEGNVILVSPPYTAYGDRAIYDLGTGIALLTGQDLRVRTARETLTARDRLTYNAKDGRMTAEGDVTITTPREKITGARGVYDSARQTATLTGGVVVTQGKNRLEGQSANVDLKTGVSKLLGSGDAASSTGRVKGVFYPKSSASPAQLNQVLPVVPTPELNIGTKAPPPTEPTRTPAAPEPEPVAEPEAEQAPKPTPAAAVPEEKAEPETQPEAAAPPPVEKQDVVPEDTSEPAADLPPEPFALPTSEPQQ